MRVIASLTVQSGDEGVRDPKEIWGTIETRCQPLGIVKEYSPWKQLVSLQYTGKDLKVSCDDFEAAVLACRQTDILPKERTVVYHFIHLVSPYFESVRAWVTQSPRGLRMTAWRPHGDMRTTDPRDPTIRLFIIFTTTEYSLLFVY